MTTKHEFNCIFCKDVFDNKEELQDHFRKHGDPLFRNRVQAETQVSDEKSKDKAEMVSCDVCPQVFPTISKAITHKHKVHPDHDAKYFCPWCGKLFTLKHLYNMHVESNHSNQDETKEKSFLCDLCCVDFFNPSAMLNHNKFFHRQDTDLPDVGQSKKFKLYNQEVIPIYYCAFCGEEYENKVNLVKHMTEDHGDENQSPDEVLKCPLCEAVFYHLDAYEIHLTFHSPDDNYSVKNNIFKDLLDYSLETLPPKIEKVEILESDGQNQDTDAETTINAVGIEKFLELAMDQSEDNPIKVKKHKKHKKSKKPAITLDEFLNMNQDVFGEGLDFEGIEEVPTRIVKKHLKNKKKLATNSATSMELEKLKKAGIVIKKKVGRKPVVKGMKVSSPKPLKFAQNKSYNKMNPDREIKTSSEVLTKLINQSNNQIRIVKKINPDSSINEPKPDVSVEKEINTSCENVREIVKESPDVLNQTKNIPLTKPDVSLNENISKDSSNLKLKELSESATPNKFKGSNLNSVPAVKQNITVAPTTNEKPREVYQDLNLPKLDNNKELSNAVDEDINKNELDPSNSDADSEEKEYISDTDNLEKNNEHTDEIGRSSEKSNSSIVSSLGTLKHLSHLITVKPVNQNRTPSSAENKKNKVFDTQNNQLSQKGNNTEKSHLLSLNDKADPIKSKNLLEKDPTLDALKILSKNITIKSLSTKRNIDDSESENDDLMNETEKPAINVKLNDVSVNQNIRMKKLKVETSEPKSEHKQIASLVSQEKTSQPGKPSVNKQAVGIKPKIINENTDSSVHTTNADILKRLTNITTKAIINTQKLSPVVKQPNEAKKIVQTEEKKEEIIEIFDIDDSEDENENLSKMLEPTQNVKSINAMKNLSKNITVKSLNQQAVIKEERQEQSYSNFRNDSTIEALINMQNRNMAFKDVLQGLHKNITIKSRNSSPNQTVQSQDTQNPKIMEDDDANDSDPCSENIKISEIHDDVCDDENNSGRFATFNMSHDDPIVESPEEDSFSDSENIHEKEYDFESEIKSNTLQKCNENMINSACLNNLKNISKNITIKSLSKNSTDKEDITKSGQKHEPIEIPIKQTPVKSSKHIIKEPQNGNMSTNKNTKNLEQTVVHAANQSVNQKISATNQVNTINKEVTVKTYQTQTVIQEITTTVTKTIKTVNQTMKQEIRNTCQSNTPMMTQRVQGIRPNQSKNLQGVVIRHAAPNLGPKTSNTVPQIRPANTVVRPSKQIVPVRAGIPQQRAGVSRPNNPRMAVAKKVTPSPSSNTQVIGKPLKISPAAMASTMAKRPNTEDVSGPFSCFKKPKESLIPVSDIPTFANSGAEEIAQFSAASHSSSNYTSTTKIVKGNSVVTAKQIKSEVNTTTQQLSRRCNTTALKFKTSQTKQTPVQEKSESSAMKRTTLEAIQRLQQQGLLVKKPRVDESNEDSDNDGDDNVGYGSADEPDE